MSDTTKKTRSPELDTRMRHDGYVTAREAGDALGMSYTGVRKAVEDGRIPGKRIETGSGSYSYWYVDIKALLAGYDGPSETRAKLVQLAKLVGRR